MPNFDGGHYFLTALIPIKTGLIEVDGLTSSPVHLVREALAVLPTAKQSPTTEQIGLNSPFSRSLRTHFTRFAVIDDVSYNGRNPANALLVAAKSINPAIGEDCDELTCPFLLWAVDFDAKSGDDAELQSYLSDLWEKAGNDLGSILGYCEGFDGTTQGEAFYRYIKRCQIETTMPFNDYWIEAPPFPATSKEALLAPTLASAGVAVFGLLALIGRLAWPRHAWVPVVLALALLILAGWVFYSNRSSLHARPIPLLVVVGVGYAGSGLLGLLAGWALGWSAWIWLAVLVLGFVLIGGAVVYTYRSVLQRGQTPFPAAPNSDLPSVLKALYLQQKFTRFAIATQGVDNPILHAEFGRFLQEHEPREVAAPTQAAGVIRS